MKTMRNSFSEGVAAFRRLTAEEAPLATVTRTRMLAGLQRRRRRGWRTVIVGASALLIVSGALAATSWIRQRSSPKLDRGDLVARVQVSSAPAPRPQPPLAMAPVDVGSAPTEGDEEELRLYGQAHAAHFARRQPRAALELWNAYLKKFPTGRFVPEASYNRALTLARLGRPRQAIGALRPIAEGCFGAYRRQEAEALIDALSPFLPEAVR
jgi:hypothetical protein